jgi:DNA-binding transcriptional LysR family regulator
MNLEELRTFLEVIDSGSLVAASKRLHVTPSTVTARLTALEAHIGQKLLHRNKSGAELTSAGFKLRRYAELMTQLWRQARYEVSLPLGIEGVCNVGLEFDLWREVGDRLLEHLRAHCPTIALALWPGEQPQLHRWLNTGLVDVAFRYAAEAAEGFASRELFDDELVMVSRGPDATTALDQSYVYVDHGEEFRREHAAAFPADWTCLVTIASSDWALDHLLRSGGKGYLPRRYVDALVDAGELFRVVGAPTFTRRVYAVENVATIRQWAWYESAMTVLAADRARGAP